MLPDLRIWLNHFEYHADQPRSVPSHISDRLSRSERALIARPLSSLLAHHSAASEALLHAAYCFSQQRAAPDVARLVELLVRESGQHARLIAVFMRRHAITSRSPHAQTARAVRPGRGRGRGAALQRQLAQRLTWQLCNVVCYRALERVTGNQRLRLLCRMLVAEQLAHIGFTADLLLALRAEQSSVARLACELRAQGCGLITVGRAWRNHRAVLARAGYGLRQFLGAVRLQYIFYMQPLPRSQLDRVAR
ncbi:MAG: hypothetical protein JOZ12_02170 [Sinobacteraceae bacterium]|nr:hypothetical protein [Nevskiaceae bacterium]